LAASAAQIVRNVGRLASTAVTFRASPTASRGTVQLPVVPVPATVYVSFGPSGDDRGPTWNAGRVSKTRHGVMGTKTARWPLEIAPTLASPPAPRVIATAAPTAAQRVRNIDMMHLSPDC
jgi:hypothetical protein